MSRRMYSKNQLENIVEDKIKGFDKAIPTDIKGEGDELYLVHDGEELAPQTRVHLKQLFGKDSLIGEGNIDLFTHYIHIFGENQKGSAYTNNGNIYMKILSTNNLKCDSIQDINTLLGSVVKKIGVSGNAYDNEGVTNRDIKCIEYTGNILASKILVSDKDDTFEEPITEYFMKNITVEDTVEAI